MRKIEFHVDLSDFCTTECPYRQKTSMGCIIHVGSHECRWCDYHHGLSDDNNGKYVVCRKED